jgi:hypothetical protein
MAVINVTALRDIAHRHPRTSHTTIMDCLTHRRGLAGARLRRSQKRLPLGFVGAGLRPARNRTMRKRSILSSGISLAESVRPNPIAHFRQILAVLPNVVLMLDQLVAQELLEMGAEPL